MKKTSIALVIEGTFPWYRGGVSEWIAQYLRAFPDYQFQIVQIATDQWLRKQISEALYELPKQVENFIRIEAPNIDAISQLYPWFESTRHRLNRSFPIADYIHIINTGLAGWLGLQYARQLQKPLILTEHALYWKEIKMGAAALECGYPVPSEQRAKSQMANMFQEMAKTIYHNADEVISVSECNIPFQRAMGARHVQYIPNGISEDWLQPDKERRGNDIPVIGWVGRCARMKNPLRFFEVIDACRSGGFTNAHFVMMMSEAGEPALWKKVTEKAKNYPELVLQCNQPAKNYMNELDALCITSLNESQPLVLFEALASRVLPVGWKAGDADQKYGLMMSPDRSPEGLIDEMVDLWNQPRKWRQAVNKRYEIVKQQHLWADIFNRYRNLFQSYR
ncbi:MAG TPA: DUF3492 domain-containing protein [Balneolaceae bacterium]|nr:DUF3492 domain-containing protein [Balneolaceae bacterium]